MKQAVARNLLVAPRKLRLIADAIRGRTITEAEQFLLLAPQHGARYLRKAMLTAVHNLELDQSSRVAGLAVDEGMKLKRYVTALKGMSRGYFKARSHVRFTFSEAEPGRSKSKKSRSNTQSKETKSFTSDRKS